MTSCLLCLALAAPAAPATGGTAASQPAQVAPVPTTVPSDRQRRRILREQAVMQDPTLRPQYLRSRSVGRAGIVVGSLGLTAGLVVSLPMWWRYRAAVDEAGEQVYRTGLEKPLRDAHHRRRSFNVSLAAAGGMTLLGTTLAIVGYTRRNRILRSIDTRLTASPVVVGGHYGMAATLRF